MGDDNGQGGSSAADRLDQVKKHVQGSAEPKRRRRKEKGKDELPADYSDILGQVETLKKMAITPDLTKRGYLRHKKAGKLWVRERVEQFVDPGTFREIGSVSGTVTWELLSPDKEKPVKFIPSNNVQGFGKLKGRSIVFTADDFTLRAGHADGALHAKTHHLETMSLSLKLPIVKLVDGSSGGGSVTTIRTQGWSYLPMIPTLHVVTKQINSGIPNLGAILGPAIGLGAARVTACHFSVMTGGGIGSLFNAGPNIIAGATFEEKLSLDELGGPGIHCTNGTIDNLAATEQDAFDQLATVLSYLPNHGLELPPRGSTDDPVNRQSMELRTLIPRRRERMYDARKLIKLVVDEGSWFEIGPLWGRCAIAGLARIGGYPVGVISNDPEVNAGALDALGSQKLTKHLKFCDVFNLPIVQFIDIPGYAVGTIAEKTATMRHGINLAGAYYGTTTPIASVITRRCFGVAGGVMIGARDPGFKVAWPSGDWGSLPLEGGIAVGHSGELLKLGKEQGFDAAKDRYVELETEYKRLMNPVRTANNFGIEEIIRPEDTRMLFATWVEHMYKVILPDRLIQRSTGRISPVFY